MRESRRVMLSFAVLVAGLVAVNVTATAFYHSTGGFGLLDLGGGANLLDGRPPYTPAVAHALLSEYGPAGRSRHAALILGADIIFPAVLATFGALALRHAARLIGLTPVVRRWLVLPPLAYLVADYTENALELTLLRLFPAEPPTLAAAASTATQVKSALGALMLGAIAVGYVVALARRRTQVQTG